jgi:hypothetical protein
MHELSEQTKRLIDFAAFGLTGLAGAVQAISLSDVALVVTIIAGVLSSAWTGVRLYDRARNGRSRAAN